MTPHQLITAEYAAGTPLADIAAAVGLTRAEVCRVARKTEPRRYKATTCREVDQVARLGAEGFQPHQIALEMGISRRRARHILNYYIK